MQKEIEREKYTYYSRGEDEQRAASRRPIKGRIKIRATHDVANLPESITSYTRQSPTTSAITRPQVLRPCAIPHGQIMVKQSSKSLAQVLSAIKKLQNIRGSTSKEIMNYITTEYDLPESTVKRQMYSALKRGVDYGILKKGHGQYCLPTETDAGSQEVAVQELGLLGLCNKHRAMRSRRGRRRGRRGRRRRRRRGRRRRRRRRSGRRRRSRYGRRRIVGESLRGILRMDSPRPCALCCKYRRPPPDGHSVR